MANTVTTTYRVNGSRNFTAVIQITGDGSGDESGTAVITAAALTGAPSKFKISKVNWDLDGFSAELFWDATTPVLALGMPTYGDEMDFYEMGAPLVNNAGAGITGNLTLYTQGLGATGRGTIVITGYQ